MPYIGNELATQFQAFVTQTITGDGSTGYTLDRAVANGKELLVYINNVKQEEGSGKAYTASGTTITFSEAVASGDSCYVVYMGLAMGTVTPPDASIVSGMIANANLEMPNTLDMNGKELILDADGDSSIQASTDDTVVFKTNNTTAMTINSSGLILPRIPILQVNATNTDQAYDASSGTVKVEWETVQVDTLNGWDSSNHRYQPTVAGFYLVGGVIRMQMIIVETIVIRIKKNGASDSGDIENSLVHQFNGPNSDIFDNGNYPIPTGLIEMNGTSDYIEVFFASEENITLHDSSTVKSHFFAQLVHAT